MLPPSNDLKRTADSALLHSGPPKRQFTNAYARSNNSLTRRIVVGPASENYKRNPAQAHDEDDDEDEDEEFQDAQEELPSSKVKPNYTGIIAEVENEDEDDQEPTAMPAARNDEESLASRGNRGSAESIDLMSDDEDLFNTTFSKKEESGESEEDAGDDEEQSQSDVEGDGSNAGSAASDVEAGGFDDEADDEPEEDNVDQKQEDEGLGSSEDGEQSNSKAMTEEQTERIDSADPTTTPSSLERRPPPPDPELDCSTHLSNLHKFHLKAKYHIPRLPLAPHRYWIGVLILDVSLKAISRENQFIWMKGNRVTTVKTVWHTYQNTTATEEFVLLLGTEKVEMTDKMCELDYFNEKKIMFRAVRCGTREARGRELCEEAVPKSRETEVIELA